MRNGFSPGTKTICLALALALSGCSTVSPMLKPRVSAPAAWNEAPAQKGTAVTAEWWSVFGSTELQDLVAAALRESPDLAVAVERVRQAEAQVRIAGASLFPSLNVGAGTSTRHTSSEGVSTSVNSASTTFSTSYELDVWGRNAAGVRSANSALQATTYDRDTARLTLIAGVATGYFQLLSLRNRLQIARQNLAIAERVQGTVGSRARNGAASALDLSRQEATVLAQRSSVLSLEQQEKQTLTALAILVGRVPEAFEVKAAGVSGLQVPSVDPGLPSELLTRRPDLASAEARLASANADIAAARAALLPSFSLTGSAGVTSGALLQFVGGGASAATLALSILQPLFDGGRLRGQVKIAESQERLLVETYRKAILAAFADVENSLVAVDRTSQQEAVQTKAQAEAANALRLAEIRYREGADDLLTVLDAQRTLFNAQDQLAQTHLNRLQAAVSLYKALGGNWSGTPPVP